MDTKAWTKQLPPDARAVLDAGLGAQPPAGAKQAVWSSLASQLPAAASVGAAAGGAKSLLLLLKPLGAGLAIGVVAAAGIVAGPSFLHHTATDPKLAPSAASNGAAQQPAQPGSPRDLTAPALEPKASSPPPAPSRTATGAAFEDDGLRPASNAATPPAALGAAGPTKAEFAPSASVAAFPTEAPPAVSTPENAVLVESRRVAVVRSLLQQGNARGMLAELAELDRAFPRGVLLQEREVLRIEALLALGERDDARAAASRFLARYPDSPHVPAVERALR